MYKYILRDIIGVVLGEGRGHGPPFKSLAPVAPNAVPKLVALCNVFARLVFSEADIEFDVVL